MINKHIDDAAELLHYIDGGTYELHTEIHAAETHLDMLLERLRNKRLAAQGEIEYERRMGSFLNSAGSSFFF